MATKNNEPGNDFYEDYWTDTNYRKTYTKTAGANKKTAETVVETRSGRKIQQTYTDDKGYTFTIRQKKEGGKVTYIAINKPNGDEKSEIRLNNDRLKDFGETTAGDRKKVMKDLPQDVIENGASLAEIYNNFKDYCGNSVPYDERTIEQVRQQELAAQNNRDPYFDDIDYDFTINDRTAIYSSLKAQNAAAKHQIQKKIDDLQTTPQDSAQEETSVKDDTISKDARLTAYIKANKSNTL
jgi:hypothetical protein